MNQIGLAIAWYVTLLVSITFHEAAHAFAAVKLGDKTAYHHGLVTLDPISHIKRSPFGMIIIPILSFVFSGWMIGWASTPYDFDWAKHHRKKTAMMSLAGPAANLVLLFASAVVIKIGVGRGFFHIPQIITFTNITEAASSGLVRSVAVIVSIFFSLNLVLLVFNMIPLPPLDGSNILLFFLSDRSADRYEALLHQPVNMMIGLVIAWNIFGDLLGPIHGFALNLLYS